MISLSSVPCKVQRQASRVVEGEALVVLMDQRALHRLNAVGTRVWELCDGRRVESIVQTIVSEFEVPPEAAQTDVLGFLRELFDAGALTLGGPP